MPKQATETYVQTEVPGIVETVAPALIDAAAPAAVEAYLTANPPTGGAPGEWVLVQEYAMTSEYKAINNIDFDTDKAYKIAFAFSLSTASSSVELRFNPNESGSNSDHYSSGMVARLNTGVNVYGANGTSGCNICPDGNSYTHFEAEIILRQVDMNQGLDGYGKHTIMGTASGSMWNSATNNARGTFLTNLKYNNLNNIPDVPVNQIAVYTGFMPINGTFRVYKAA
jgi:hypothetical protein